MKTASSFVLLFLGFILSGCGSPVFSPKTVHQLSHVSIERIDGRIGQVLRNHLKNIMKTRCPLYNLTLVLMEQERPLVLNRQGQSSIGHYILKAEYTLCRRRDQYLLGRGTLRSYGVKPMTASYYSQTVMDQATQTRALRSIREKILYAVAMDLNRATPCPCPLLKNSPDDKNYAAPK